jgi:hypothetical protein
MKSGVKPAHSKARARTGALETAAAFWSAAVLRRFGCFGLTAGFARNYLNKSTEAARLCQGYGGQAGLCSSVNHD